MADSEPERRRILEAVADGSLSPAEAAERLASLDEAEAGSTVGPDGGSRGGLRRVRIVATGHAVRVTAEPNLREPAIDGPHTAQREGDTLVIQPEDDTDTGDFFIASVPHWQRRAEPMHRMWRSAPPLVVRMPADLALAADVTASSLVVRDVKGPIAVNLAAGSAKVSGFAAPIDVDVSAGSFSGNGVLDRGESSVRCSAGSVKLQLAKGSSVRVRGIANAGRLSLPFERPVGTGGRPRRPPLGPFFEEHERVIGDGAGVLDIEVTTGSVAVRAES
ncbi:MAG: SHOCT-like domain-containing protein [Acidimicrobiales bacterium]